MVNERANERSKPGLVGDGDQGGTNRHAGAVAWPHLAVNNQQTARRSRVAAPSIDVDDVEVVAGRIGRGVAGRVVLVDFLGVIALVVVFDFCLEDR